MTPPRRSPQRSARHSKSRRRSRSRQVPRLLYAFRATFFVHYCMTHQIIDFIDRAAYSLTTIERGSLPDHFLDILGYRIAFPTSPRDDVIGPALKFIKVSSTTTVPIPSLSAGRCQQNCITTAHAIILSIEVAPPQCGCSLRVTLFIGSLNIPTFH